MSTSLEDLAASTFHENIQYLAKHHRNIYNKLLAFDTGVEKGIYNNMFDLVIKEDYFDLVNLSTGDYFYNFDSNEYASLASETINFKRDENLFETFKKLPIELETEHFIDIAPTLKYIQNNLEPSKEMQSIKKFIFFGTGLGTHIVEIDKKINADMYLIIEDNIEVFKFSLFTTPYFDLGKKTKLTFSVSDTKEEFESVANSFLNREFQYNHYIKYFEMMKHGEDKLKEFHLRVISLSHNVFFYKDILTQYLTPIEYIENNYMFLNMLSSYEETSLNKKPVIMLAAGPSLQANIEWLKKNKNKFIIVAASSTLNILEKENISPDIVTHLDAFESSTAHFDKLKSLSFLDDTLFFLSARIQGSVVEKLKKEHIFFYENGTSYKQNIGNLSAACVGSTTYLILLALGVKDLYLLGLDLALDSKTGSTHSDEHHFSEKLDLDSSQKHEDVMDFSTTVVKTAGNFQEEVYTKPEYLLSITSINASSMGFKQDNQNVYNLNSGAYFQNTIPTNIHNIDIDNFTDIEKTSLTDELKDSFTKKGSSTMSEDELSTIKGRIAHAIALKEEVLSQQNYRYKNQDEFLESLSSLLSKLTSEQSVYGYDTSFILQEYSKFIYTFIFDFFNTENLENVDLHAEKINELLCRAFLRILNEYTGKLQESLDLNLS